MMRPLIVLFILSAFSGAAVAQDFTFGAITQPEMDMKKYSNDTSVHAVVLQEYGKTIITVDNDDNRKLIYEYHVKIKVFDNLGFDEGTIEIPVYNSGDGDFFEEVTGIKGVTFYKDDNGGVQRAELDNSKIYPVKENKYYGLYKFAMPAMRKGCVIEYTYKLISPDLSNFHSWAFQSNIPKVYSEYEVHIPGFWNYNASLKGLLKLSKNTSEVEHNCFSTRGSSCDCSFITYGMSDIPAFKTEEYMTSPKNFMSSINFELMEYTSPYDGIKRKMAKEWKDIDYQLKDNPYFGGQLKRKGLFKDRVLPVIAGKTDELSKAKAIYAYIQKNIKWNNFYGIYSDGLGKPIEEHSGTVSDINLSLVVALNAAGVKTETVLLSTRDHGTLNPLYPGMGDFNYVVAKANIGDQSYLLDASDPLLPFGMLPFKCLNDKGRVFSLDKPSYFIDLNLPQKEKNTRNLEFTLQEDGKLKGTYIEYSLGFSAYEKRKAIKKYNSVDEYVEKLNSESPKEKILQQEIMNLDSVNEPLSEKYEMEINAYDKLSNSFAFNPFFRDRVVTNPFRLNERAYPVDMGMASDERYTVVLHLPEQYTIENSPQALSVLLPNSGGKFLTSFDAQSNTYTFANVIQLNKSTYSSEEYPYLKEFYNKIIQSEKAEIIFKKK